MPTIAAKVSAIGPDGTELQREIAHRFDEETEITTGFMQFNETVTAPQIISITIQFATEVGAALVAAWIYDKLRGRKGAMIEMEGIRITDINVHDGTIRQVMLDKLKVEQASTHHVIRLHPEHRVFRAKGKTRVRHKAGTKHH